MSHRVVLVSMLFSVIALSGARAGWASGSTQHAVADDYRLRMCALPDCSVPLASEPYQWMTKDGRVLNSGITDDRGYATVSRAHGVTEYALENISFRWDMKVEDKCWSAELETCARMVKTAQHEGFDDPQSVAERQKEKASEEQLKQDEEQARLAQYRKTALANDDVLAWLGPLPPEWSEQEFRPRLHTVYDRIRNDLKDFDYEQAFLSFECKAPSAFGPVPDAAAVTAYVRSEREGMSTDEKNRAWTGLVEAARQGNWQARQFLYQDLEASIKVRHNDNLVLAWRWLQLLEWLQARQAGVLYGKYMDDVRATGIGNGLPGNIGSADIFAAVHGSYSFMQEVARAMSAQTRDTDFGVPATDPEYQEKLAQFRQFQATVKNMGDCPHRMMPEMFPAWDEAQ